MTHDKVAESSKLLAAKYTAEKNYGRAFAHYLVVFQVKPNWQERFKDEFVKVLLKWGSELCKANKFKEVVQSYERALEVFPDDAVILNNLGSHLLKWSLYKEAAYYFRDCLSIDPYFLRAGRNLEDLSDWVVDRWHFRMLNDQRRNEAFREAILKKIAMGFDTVLDIGTGTGLLSLCAYEGRASEVYACEVSHSMAEIARSVFKDNNATNIKLINKHSDYLEIPDDINEKVSLLVTETFDCGLLGEHVVSTISLAWKNLLRPAHPSLTSLDSSLYGIVIPYSATLYITGIEFETFANDFHIRKKRHLFSMKGINVVRELSTYDSDDLSRKEYKSLTNTETVFCINFNDPNMQTDWERTMELVVTSTGRLDCFAVWFDLRLDEDIVLSTNPRTRLNAAWDQAIFPIPRSLTVREGQKLNLSLKVKNCLLKIDMKNLSPAKHNFKASPEVIETLNCKALEKTFSQMAGILSERYNDSVHVLDCYPFPVFGFNFLVSRKDRFKDKLTCFAQTSSDRRLIRQVAKKNKVDVHVILTSKCNFENWKEKVDIVLLNLIESTGDIKDSVLSQLDLLTSYLNPGGIILPEYIEVIGQFIYSDWLTRCSRVVDNSVTCGFNIAENLNVFRANHFIDFSMRTVEHMVCSEPIRMFSLFHGLNSVTEMVALRLPNTVYFNGLVYWLKIRFLEGCSTLSTSNFYNQSVFLFPKMEFPSELRFEIIRNDGLFAVKLFDEVYFS